MTSPALADSFGSRTRVVAATHLRPWPTTISIVVLAASVVPMLMATGVIRLALSGLVAMTVGVVAMFSVLQLRRQLDNVRSALMPGFRLPHILMAALFVAAPNVLVPLAVSNLTGISFAGLFAYSLAITAIAAWCSYDPFGVVVVLVLFFNLLPHEVQFQDKLISDATAITPLGAGICAVVSGLAIAVLFAIFARFNGEGSRETTSRGIGMGFSPRPADGEIPWRTGPLTGLIVKLLTWIQSLVDRCGRAVIAEERPVSRLLTSRRRIPLRRRVTLNGLSAGFLGFFFPFAVIVVYLLVNTEEPVFIKEASTLFFTVPAAVFACFIGVYWPRYWLYIPLEALVPATRMEFVREKAAALALDVFWYWVGLSATASVGLLMVARDDLSGVGECIVIYSLLSAAILVASAGVFAWATLFRNAIVSIIAVPIAMAIVIFANALAVRGSEAVAVGVLMVVAIVLGAIAYRGWLKVDLA